MPMWRIARLVLVYSASLACVAEERAGAFAQAPDANHDVAELLNEVHQIPIIGAPGAIIPFGPHAFPLVVGHVDEKKVVPVVWLMPRLGQGRIVAFSHDGYFSDKPTGDLKRLLLNAVEWAGGGRHENRPGGRRVLVYQSSLLKVLQGSAHQATAADVQTWRQHLNQCDVFCIDTDFDNKPELADAVRRFVHDGGGLVTAGTGWGWAQTSPQARLAWRKIMSAIVSSGRPDWSCPTSIRAGRADDMASSGRRRNWPAPGKRWRTFARIHKQRKIMTRTTLPRRARFCKRRSGPCRVMLKYFGPSFVNLWKKFTPCRCRTSPFPKQTPWHASRWRLRTSNCRGCRRKKSRPIRLRSAFRSPYPQVRSPRQPSAASTRRHQPGTASGCTPRPRHRHSRSRRRRQRLEERSPSADADWLSHRPIVGSANLGTVAQSLSPIGDHPRNDSHRQPVRRSRVYRRARSLQAGIPVHAAIPGAIEAPLYVLGETDVAHWNAHIRKLPGPWAELACPGVIVTALSHMIRNLDDPKSLMEFWNRAVALERTRWRCTSRASVRCPERFVADQQISAGYMHSGYPIMCGNDMYDYNVSITPSCAARQTPPGARGQWHELGHNHQSDDWTPNNAVEVTVKPVRDVRHQSVLRNMPLERIESGPHCPLRAAA